MNQSAADRGPTATTFGRLLTGLARGLNLELGGGTVVEQLRALDSLCAGDTLVRAQVQEHARYLRSVQRIRSEALDPSGDLLPLALENIFVALVHGASHRTASPPKTHHWVPVAYMGNFSEGQGKSRGVRARVTATGLFSTGHLALSIGDSVFAHAPVDGRGHYDLILEYAFSLLEGTYSQNLGRLETTQARASLLAFTLVQSLRNPVDGGFPAGDLATLLGGVFRLGDTLGPLHVATVESRRRIGFTPYFPSASLRLVDGALVHHMPLTSHLAMLISSVPLDPQRTVDLLRRLSRNTVARANRTHSIIFGLTPDEVRRFLP